MVAMAVAVAAPVVAAVAAVVLGTSAAAVFVILPVMGVVPLTPEVACWFSPTGVPPLGVCSVPGKKTLVSGIFLSPHPVTHLPEGLLGASEERGAGGGDGGPSLIPGVGG